MRSKPTPKSVRQPRRFMGPPLFVVRDTKVPRARRARLQLEHLERLLEDTPLIELPVSEAPHWGGFPSWYELSGYFLGLKLLLTEEERDASWRAVKAFRQRRLKEEKLSRVSHVFFAFDHFEKINKRRWARETGYDATRWAKIKADPERLKKRRQQNAEVQRRRRQAQRLARAEAERVPYPYAEAAE